MPEATDPQRRPPVAAATAAVLALPGAFITLSLGSAAQSVAGTVGDDAGQWMVLVVTIGWTATLLVGAVRLLLGSSWLGLAVPAAILAALMTVGLAQGGLGDGFSWFHGFAWAVGVAATVLAALPQVRHWVARRRRQKLHPGSVRATSSRP
ncbi:hypothetical protein ACI797_17235 [Geodermatophilus sp. SYSU D00691]